MYYIILPSGQKAERRAPVFPTSPSTPNPAPNTTDSIGSTITDTNPEPDSERNSGLRRPKTPTPPTTTEFGDPDAKKRNWLQKEWCSVRIYVVLDAKELVAGEHVSLATVATLTKVAEKEYYLGLSL